MQDTKDQGAQLKNLSVELIDGEFVFLTLAGGRYGECSEFEPIAAVTEKEGLTLVIPRAKADEFQLAYEVTFRRITLSVHSSTDSIGYTLASSAKLAEYGISANVIAGSFDDHLFVPSDRAEDAMSALGELKR